MPLATVARLPHRNPEAAARPAGLLVALGLLLTLAPLAVGPAGPAYATGTATISIDFREELAATPGDHIGFTATEFSVEGGAVPSSDPDQRALRALGAGAVRIQLAPDGRGGVLGGASGADRSIDADRWLTSYEAMGLEPTVIVPLDKSDALTVQAYLHRTGHRVRRYIVGNEMDSNSKSSVTEDVYVERFEDVATALRTADPTIQVGGPGAACWDCLRRSLVDKLVTLPAAGRPSFIDWHEYGSGDGQEASMSSSYRYANELSALKAWLPTDGSVGIQVGEFNMNWGDESGNGSVKQSVWNAVALGTILTSGATAFQYGDKNQALGLVNGGSPKASYWGLAMFTGYGRFRGFGDTAVRTSSSDTQVRVFASTRGRDVVVVNTSTIARASRITLRGHLGATAQRWVLRGEMSPYRNPDKTIQDGELDLWLPPMSVQTLVLT